MKLTYYFFKIEKNVGISGYESLGFHQSKNYLLNRVLCYQRFWMELTVVTNKGGYVELSQNMITFTASLFGTLE